MIINLLLLTIGLSWMVSEEKNSLPNKNWSKRWTKSKLTTKSSWLYFWRMQNSTYRKSFTFRWSARTNLDVLYLHWKYNFQWSFMSAFLLGGSAGRSVRPSWFPKRAGKLNLQYFFQRKLFSNCSVGNLNKRLWGWSRNEEISKIRKTLTPQSIWYVIQNVESLVLKGNWLYLHQLPRPAF